LGKGSKRFKIIKYYFFRQGFLPYISSEKEVCYETKY